METTVNRLEDNKVELKVTVPASEVSEALKSAYATANKSRIRGFRLGKAPRNVLDRVFGGSEYFLAEATDEVIKSTYLLAIDEQGFVPLDSMDMESVEPAVEGQDYTYSFTISVAPELALSSYDPVEIELPAVEPTALEIQSRVDTMLGYYVEYEDINDRSSLHGDILTLDITVTLDGQKVDNFSGEGLNYELGSGIMPEDFENNLLDVMPGSELDFDFHLHLSNETDHGHDHSDHAHDHDHDDHSDHDHNHDHDTDDHDHSDHDHDADDENGTDDHDHDDTESDDESAAGDEPLEYHVEGTLVAIRKKVLPEFTDEWVKEKLDYDSAEIFRQLLADSLRDQKQSALPDLKERRVAEAIGDRLIGDPPALIVSEMSQDIYTDVFMTLQNQGITLDAYLASMGMDGEGFRENVTGQAEKNARQVMALDEWGRHFEIEVSEEDIRNEFARAVSGDEEAEPDEETLQAAMQQWISNGRMTEIRRGIIRTKVTQQLIEEAIVTEEKPVEESAETAADDQTDEKPNDD